jgi:hypothetical protein
VLVAPYPPENATPQAAFQKTVVNGLLEPQNMVVMAPWLVVSTKDGLFLVGSDTGTVASPDTAIPTGDITALAVDSNSVYVAVDGHIWQLNLKSEEPDSLVTEASGLTAMIHDGLNLYWSNDSTIYRVDSEGKSTILASQLHEVSQLVVFGTDLFFTQAGQENATQGGVGKISVTGGAVTMLVGHDVLGNSFEARAVAVNSEKVIVGIVQRNWPYAGAICTTSHQGGNLTCHTQSAPGLNQMQAKGQIVHWTTSQTLSRIDLIEGAPYQVPGIFTRPGSMVWTSEWIAWTEPLAGRIMRVDALPSR